MYRRIRFSISSQENSRSIWQCLSFLKAGKFQDENQIFTEYAHDIFNHGSLCKENKDLVAIFSVAEAFFLSSATNQSSNIDIKPIASALLKN